MYVYVCVCVCVYICWLVYSITFVCSCIEANVSLRYHHMTTVILDMQLYPMLMNDHQMNQTIRTYVIDSVQVQQSYCIVFL